GDGPGSVAVADLNRDGVPDLAVANYYSNTVSVLLGSGRALVATPVLSPAGGTFTAAVIVTITDSTPGATIYYTTDGSKAMAAASGMTNSSVTSATYTIQQSVAPPSFNPAGGTFAGSVAVTMSTTTSGASIYYTTDGSTPTTASSVYTGPVPLTTTTTLKAMAAASGMANSSVTSAAYTIRVVAPTFSPAGGTYTSTLSVSISETTPGATIYYTTDGSTPTTASTPYTGPVPLTTTTTLKAMAAASGMANSSVASATYTISQAVAPPTFNPPGGSFAGSVTVTMSTTTSGATIYYTSDGSTPTTASSVYTVPVPLTTTTTLRAMAAASGMTNSSVTSATYTIQQSVAPPSFNPAGGSFAGSVTVTMSTTTSGATIYYTTDGSTPTTAPGVANSAVTSATYTLQTATPTFNPSGGTYVLPQLVSISDATPGATIYYTTDGSTPTTASSVYSGPILVITRTTIKAMAVAP